LYRACTELVVQISTSYKCVGARWTRKENLFPSDLNRHAVLQSEKKTLAHSHETTTQAALNKLVNHAGVPQDAVEAAIGKARGHLGRGCTRAGIGGDLRCCTHLSGSDPTWGGRGARLHCSKPFGPKPEIQHDQRGRSMPTLT
jgi:hypothetical protein